MSRTARHRRGRGRPRRAGRVVVPTVAFLVAAGVSAYASGSEATPARPAAAALPASGGSGQAVVVGRYAGAEAQAVLERARPVSRDSARQTLEEATGRAVGEPRSDQGRQHNGDLAELAARAEKEAAALTRAWVLPLAPGYRLTAGFGECSALWAHCHTGLDFAAPRGTPVRAVAEGTVTEVGPAGAYGNRTVETLEDGTELWYCHQDTIGVGVGDQVAAGQEIGRVGSTGNTTGPHLHLEVRPGAGDPVDPAVALTAHGVTP
jgi:murein DD-endopeptidase MepM/ murein hydrolase activator NlpD